MGLAQPFLEAPDTCDQRRGESQGLQNNEPQRAKILKLVDDYWSKIKATAAMPPGDDDSDEKVADYWIGMLNECNRLYDEMLQEGRDDRAVIEAFVDKFGSKDSASDVRWLLCRPQSTMDFNGFYPVHSERHPTHRKQQLLVAEFQVRRFLKDQKAFERYYEFVVWTDWIFTPDVFGVSVDKTDKGFQRDGEYWWHARNFILFAHATGRDDLFKGVAPSDLQPRFVDWQKWLKSEGAFLREKRQGYGWTIDKEAKQNDDRYAPFVESSELPTLENRPATPFTPWKGPKALSTRKFRGLNS